MLLAMIAALSVLDAKAATTDAPASAKPNPKLTAIPENSWQKVAGFAPAPGGILAYSGGVYDSAHHEFLIFGGGHADYWGNEVCAFSPATLSWRRMYEPDAQSRSSNANLDHLHGKLRDSDKPYTRHTYNQQCFVESTASMFIFGGCGPGWGDLHPPCVVPPDAWSYSLKDNRWSELYAGDGAPGGYAMACCYDAKRDVVWAYGHESQLSRFDLKTRRWTSHVVHPAIDYVGGYNFHLLYLPTSDRLLVVGSDTATIDLDTFVAELPPRLTGATGKAGLAYLAPQDAVLYVALPGGETGPDYRTCAFDCGKRQWRDIRTNGLTATGAVWNRLQYDPIDGVALMVVDSGVWAYKPPGSFGP